MTAYYNEIDPFAAAWLRELISAGHIAPGDVDERSIEDVRPDDLVGYRQCHFFAGIGGWSYALRLAGWPDDRPVWTASCPCQPFSAAGKGAGFDDERHLWPSLHWLIRERRPAILVGEQVSSKAAELWLDLVQADLEAMDYAFGCVAFPAAGVGAPHIRDRAFWMADGQPTGLQRGIPRGPNSQRETINGRAGLGRAIGRLGHAHSSGSSARSFAGEADGHRGPFVANGGDRRPGPVNGHWRDADWLYCRDGKWRPVEPGTFPLAHGVSNRVGRLRGYGNAIVPQAAAEFVKACLAPTP